jgi:hypothetical protein
MPRKKSRLAVIDFETDPFEHNRIPEPFVVGFYDGADYFDIWSDDCAALIADFLRVNKTNCYAHNGGKFDFFFLLQYLAPRIKIINGRIAKAEIGETTLLDSYLILPLPLSAYAKDDIDYRIMERSERDKPENKQKIREYLRSDCVYLWEWVNKFVSRFGDRLTLASAAFSQLKKTGYPTNLRTYQGYDNEFRPFYFGGRTEAIKRGYHPGHFKIYDINSAYPYAMLSEHPLGSDYEKIQSTPQNPIKTLPENGAYFAKVRAVSRGCFPRRLDSGAVDFFRDDEPYDYFVTGWEIQAGLDTGTVDLIEIDYVLVHNETRNFLEYVDKFYAEKLEGKQTGDKDLETFAKLMLNSAYGKFGQNGLDFREFSLADQGDIPLTMDELQEAENYVRYFGGSLQEYIATLGWEFENDTPFGKSLWSRPDPDERYYNVATAASITGFVRAYLWRAICQAQTPIYCDTDSIICESFAGEVGNDLGQWKLEGETKKGVYIGGKKLYTLELEGEAKFKQDAGLIRYKGGKVTALRFERKFKKAHKGAKLTHDEIVSIVKEGKEIEWHNPAPSFNLKRGTNFVSRKIKRT